MARDLTSPIAEAGDTSAVRSVLAPTTPTTFGPYLTGGVQIPLVRRRRSHLEGLLQMILGVPWRIARERTIHLVTAALVEFRRLEIEGA